MTPTFDRDGYPTNDTLDRIIGWKESWYSWLAFCADAWNQTYGKVNVSGNTFVLITGGWSGNESIIAAMRENIVGWSLTWYSSTRGGRYEFRVEKP